MLGPLLIPSLLLLIASEGDGPAAPTLNDLVFTRQNGTQVEFGDRVQAWCGPWEAGEVETQAVHVMGGQPGTDRWWYLRAVRSDIQLGQPLALPNDFIFDQPRGAHLFVLDEPDELATDTGGPGGSITFQRLECGAGGEVAFSIDTRLESELGGGPWMTIRGTYEGPVSSGR